MNVLKEFLNITFLKKYYANSNTINMNLFGWRKLKKLLEGHLNYEGLVFIMIKN